MMPRIPGSAAAVCLPLLAGCLAPAQSTQGILRGRVVDSISGAGLPSAQVAYTRTGLDQGRLVFSDSSGFYHVAFLSPGSYRLRVTSAGYQSQDLFEIVVPVAGVVETDFRLRPLSDLWEADRNRRSVFLPGGALLMFFGPDVDTSRSASFEAAQRTTGDLEPSLSNVVESRLLRDVPLNGRDPYALLLAQPGVTSEASTGKGLGFSVNGQRPTAGNFLLDGLENNNVISGGPLATPPPEAIQEYRLSTNNFSAEYGRAAGFLANAISRPGGDRWHGTAYLYGKHNTLNANEFQRNRRGLPRAPLREWQPGFTGGGKFSFFYASLSGEHFDFASESDPYVLRLPTTALSRLALPGSFPRLLLEKYGLPINGPGLTVLQTFKTPRTTQRTFLMPRLDAPLRGGRDQFFSRVNWTRYYQPNFSWSPYPDFVMPLLENTWAGAGGYIRPFGPGMNELRVGSSRDLLAAARPHPEVPVLQIGGGTMLPGSGANYGYSHDASQFEATDTFRWARKSHLLSVGGGFLGRRLDSELTAYRDGEVIYGDPRLFAIEQVTQVSLALVRGDPGYATPDQGGRYTYAQYTAFLQDSVRVRRWLTLNAGLRYEYFGSPRPGLDKGWAQLAPGAGDTFYERVATARLQPQSTSALLASDRNNWAPRVGFSWRPGQNSGPVMRGSYGVFFDRPFDNLWQTTTFNKFEVMDIAVGQTLSLDRDLRSSLRADLTTSTKDKTNKLTLIQPGIRTPYVHAYFLAAEQSWGPFSLRLAGAGSLGRKLMTTDLLNRWGTSSRGGSNPNPRFSDDFIYRANQGSSSYHGFTALARWQSTRALWQAGYTWSHAIDNQSDALAGEFNNLGSLVPSSGRRSQGLSTGFLRQFDSDADRGNADFDQRHNLVMLGSLSLPGAGWLLRGWHTAHVLAWRSGLPFSVFSTDKYPLGLRNNRAHLLASRAERTDVPVPGGSRLLTARDFAEPAAAGNLGRNSLAGPGLFNFDVSLNRSFAWEARRLTLRADVLNIANHANLGNPSSTLGDTTFGIAERGRRGLASGFPSQLPFDEPARQVQLLLRFEF